MDAKIAAHSNYGELRELRKRWSKSVQPLSNSNAPLDFMNARRERCYCRKPKC